MSLRDGLNHSGVRAVLQLMAACRGALNGLMVEVILGHVRFTGRRFVSKIISLPVDHHPLASKPGAVVDMITVAATTA